MHESNSHIRGSLRTDRRVTRTRAALRDALHVLIHEKGYSAVTVEEITQRAGVGRATFYLHYKDKEDLLLEELSQLARNRVQLLSGIPLNGWSAEANPPFLPLLLVFQNAAANQDLYKVILHGEGAASITARLRNIIHEALVSLVQVQAENPISNLSISAPLDLLASYLAGALTGTLTWWLDQPPPLDAEEMTLTFQRMFFPGASYVFGISG